MTTQRISERELGLGLLVLIGLIAYAVYSLASWMNVSPLTVVAILIGIVLAGLAVVWNWKERRFDRGLKWTTFVFFLVGFLGTFLFPVLNDWSALAISKPDFGTLWNQAPWYTNPYLRGVASLSPGFITWGIVRLAERVARRWL